MFYASTFAVLLALFGCVQSRDDGVIVKTACKGQWLNIDCPARSAIDVRWAKYGRQPGDKVCGYVYGDCIAQNSFYAVRTKCQGEKWCKIRANQAFFGSYCSGRNNHLSVGYTCDYTSMRNNIVCQGGTLILDCRSGHHIVIDNAIFGRVHGIAECPKDPYWVENVNCIADSSFRVVKRKCHGKRRCRVAAQAGVFGDPCPETWKYLSVRYTCKRNGSGSSGSGSSGSGSSGSGSSGSGSSGSGSSGSGSSGSGSSGSGSSGSGSSGSGSSETGSSGSGSSGKGSSGKGSSGKGS